MAKNLAESARGHGPSPLPKQLRILVADDDRDAVLTLMTLLRDDGHDVRGVYKGRQALDAFASFEPDVLLLDIALPELSGWEVAREIKARHRKHPLIVGISGDTKTPVVESTHPATYHSAAMLMPLPSTPDSVPVLATSHVTATPRTSTTRPSTTVPN